MCRMSLSDRTQTKSHVLYVKILAGSISAPRKSGPGMTFSLPLDEGQSLKGDIWFPRWKKNQVTLNCQGQMAALLGKSPDKITGLFMMMMNIVKWKA